MSCDCECKTTLPQGATGPTGATGAAGAAGADGTSYYLYVAYAQDNAGTGFTTNPAVAQADPTYKYFAVKTSTTVLVPVAADFAGLWMLFQGPAGTGANFFVVNTVANMTALTTMTNGDIAYVKTTNEFYQYNATLVTWQLFHADAWTSDPIGAVVFTGAVGGESFTPTFYYEVDGSKVHFNINGAIVNPGANVTTIDVDLTASFTATLRPKRTTGFTGILSDVGGSATYPVYGYMTTAGHLLIYRNPASPASTKFPVLVDASIEINGYFERNQ